MEVLFVVALAFLVKNTGLQGLPNRGRPRGQGDD